MAKIARNTPGVVTVYDEDGNSSVCALVDAKERVLTGRWSYKSPAPKEAEPLQESVIEEPEPAPKEAEPPEEVKQDEPRSGGRKRQVKR